jgi:anti-sigma factor ChrR (cupin superfamily)
MITEQQQEQASLYALGALTAGEERAFERELRSHGELRELVFELQRTIEALAKSVPQGTPSQLKAKILERIEQAQAGRAAAFTSPRHDSGAHGTTRYTPAATKPGLSFQQAASESGWKALPVPGAFIKLLSIERERGYAVLLGKIEAGVRYPAHVNAGPEDFYILSGDLVVGDRKLKAGDFHHAEKGSQHEVNYSVEGCTLLAVLTTDDPLVAFAMS